MTKQEKIDELMKDYEITYGTERFYKNFNDYFDKAVEEAECLGYK